MTGDGQTKFLLARNLNFFVFWEFEKMSTWLAVRKILLDVDHGNTPNP